MSGAASEEIIAVSGLSLSLGGKKILHDISLGVGRKDFLCLVGRNGAGKSTLFKCILGVFKNFSGTVKLAGKSSSLMSSSERARLVSYVPQSVPPDLPYTAGEFMAMSRYPWRSVRNSPEADANAVKDALELTGTEPFAARRLSDLSGGERQKVMIASAIAQGSEAILMDEPTTFLDYARQAEAMELMSRVNREKGVAMVVVTHDVNFAMSLADKVAAISDGRLIWAGTPGEFETPGLLSSIFGVPFERYFSKGENSRPLFAPAGRP